MLAAFAEHERYQIRARTKAALAAAKARGVVLGRYGGGPKRTMQGPLRVRGLTVAQITEIMNQRCIPTVRGKRWAATGHGLIHRIRSISPARPQIRS
jgi:DNA invertase Pin-like site-specific DNA recombinase